MEFGKRLRSRIWRGSVDDEVDAELAFHVEMRARELVARGMTPEDARATAIRRFGDINRVNATCRREGRRRDRDMRRTEYLSEFAQDATFASRQLLRNPGFTLVAIVTLALGIGATAAIFSAVNAVVLRPLPVPNPDRILAVYTNWRGSPGNISAGNFVHGIATARAFSDVTAIQYSSFNLADAEDAERVIGARTTAGFFNVFGTQPQHGRVYGADEDQPGREQVVVLSHRLWSRKFGSDPAIVGRPIRLNGRQYEVIGIMPALFDFTARSEELWVPVAFTPERKATHDEHYLQVYGRLRPDASREQALSELQQRAADLKVKAPRDNAELGFTVTNLMDELVGDYRRRLYIMLGAVGLVLLIACGNIANLLLARGAARSGEMAMRAALGAGRGRIVRQLMTESAVLAAVSGTAGLALAWWGVQALVSAAPPGVPRLEQTAVDPLVLAFTLAIAVLCAVLFGLAPALRAARTDVQTVLKEGGRGAASGGIRDRLRTGLIVAELALALMLLVGTGLFIRSAIALDRTPPGFNPNGVLTVRLSLPASEYETPDRIVQTFERILDAARQVPGVTRRGADVTGSDGPRRQRQRPHSRGTAAGAGKRDQQPASHRDARVLRNARHPDRPRARARRDRSSWRAQGDGHQRSACGRRVSRPGPDRPPHRLLRTRTRRKVSGLQDRRRRGGRRSMARPGRGAITGVLPARGAGPCRCLELDSANDVRGRADADGAGGGHHAAARGAGAGDSGCAALRRADDGAARRRFNRHRPLQHAAPHGARRDRTASSPRSASTV